MEELEDEDAGEDTAAAEAEARKVFEEMVDTQARLGEEPRFTEAVKGTVNFGRGSGTDDTGLWGCVVLWRDSDPSRAGSGTALTPHTLPCMCRCCGSSSWSSGRTWWATRCSARCVAWRGGRPWHSHLAPSHQPS